MCVCVCVCVCVCEGGESPYLSHVFDTVSSIVVWYIGDVQLGCESMYIHYVTLHYRTAGWIARLWHSSTFSQFSKSPHLSHPQ